MKTVIIGPCALENIDQVAPIVAVASKFNVPYFRAQLFKPRTSPESFQGLGRRGLPIIDYLLDNNLKLVCETCSIDQMDEVIDFASIIQIGARNMQNFELLKHIGKRYNFKNSDKKVLLKRGFANTTFEWISSAKYLEQSGIPKENIVLCERGSRHHASPSGVVLDLALAYKVKQETDYEVIIDPSHGTRESSLVLPLAKATCAMGFDGLMIESHPQPSKSVSDPQHAVTPLALDEFFSDVTESGLLSLRAPEIININKHLQSQMELKTIQ